MTDTAKVKVYWMLGMDRRNVQIKALAAETGVKLEMRSLERGWVTTTVKYDASGTAEQMDAFQARLAEIT